MMLFESWKMLRRMKTGDGNDRIFSKVYHDIVSGWIGVNGLLGKYKCQAFEMSIFVDLCSVVNPPTEQREVMQGDTSSIAALFKVDYQT